ncbi:cobalamin-binding protein [Halieaceae bacterium IMCC14734]|uniref:Cobalamin-binding protein n=1 Tax=Candidatus Litorirhabdus singularis TaxID=2518993 RepID=A0ABT3TKZ2_9GAMM|nr:cobalamin-binding protein [Candidatus Litorirhabdus singularis]MCX2982989.1 cobalamin-binding protein [Candidatus Litorirhabdus singularis]
MRSLLLGVLLLSAAAAASAEVTVIDFHQREVTLEQPAQRIIALAPHIVENVFSAGAGAKLVGVASYSNYPQGADQIPVVGDYQAWSLEAIVALRPDLILMWASGNGLQKLESLTRLGIPVYVSELRELSDIPASIRSIGKLAGTIPVSAAEADRLEREIVRLGEQYRQRPTVEVFYQVWNAPLQTINGEHMISRVLELCGAHNAFADAVSLAPKINVESVLHRNPDAIVASGMGAARPEWLDEWSGYPALRAVQRESLFWVDPDYLQRPTARMFIGAARLCRQLDSSRQ